MRAVHCNDPLWFLKVLIPTTIPKTKIAYKLNSTIVPQDELTPEDVNSSKDETSSLFLRPYNILIYSHRDRDINDLMRLKTPSFTSDIISDAIFVALTFIISINYSFSEAEVLFSLFTVLFICWLVTCKLKQDDTLQLIN